MSSQTEVAYTARIRAPQVLERGRAQTTDLAVYRDGALAAPSSGTYSLITPTGTATIDAVAVTVTGSIATYAIPALSLPSTLSMGEGYTEQWALVMPDTTTRTFIREVSLSKFQFACPVTDLDLKAEYPDILEDLGGYSTDLQDWIDEGTVQFLNRLYRVGEWPEVIVTRAATREPIKQLSLWLIFKFLFSKQPNATRYQDLKDEHKDRADAEFSGMTYRVDRDQDGVPDDMGRHTSTTVVHRNVPPLRHLKRTWRW